MGVRPWSNLIFGSSAYSRVLLMLTDNGGNLGGGGVNSTGAAAKAVTSVVSRRGFCELGF